MSHRLKMIQHRGLIFWSNSRTTGPNSQYISSIDFCPVGNDPSDSDLTSRATNFASSWNVKPGRPGTGGYLKSNFEVLIRL